ncbi:MAG: FHA domain-containing protein [Candidatus Binataceae bacterium]|nr:FHA domain-containing protein [Candidatus Binataceae bacterium]
MFKRAQPARLLAVNQPPMGPRLMILGRSDVVVGNGSASALQIADSSLAHSHAVISRRRGRYVVSNTKSAGGTFVNDKRVRRSRTLKHRDSIRFRHSQRRLSWCRHAWRGPSQTRIHQRRFVGRRE